MTRYTTDHVEASLCAWEWMLQNEKLLSDVWGEVGTPTMRTHCIELGPYIDDVYNLIPQDICDGVVFDWAVVPAIMGHVDWDANGTMRLPSVATMASVVSRELEEMYA